MQDRTIERMKKMMDDLEDENRELRLAARKNKRKHEEEVDILNKRVRQLEGEVDGLADLLSERNMEIAQMGQKINEGAGYHPTEPAYDPYENLAALAETVAMWGYGSEETEMDSPERVDEF